MAGIKIKWLSDDADAIRGARKVQESLEDVADEMKDVSKESDRTADDISDDLRSIERDADQAGRKIGTDLDDGFKKAKRGADDFKSEAKQSGREAAASFSGEFEDVGDVIQEVAANAFGGFGPAGEAAGLAAAVGLGVVMTALSDQAEKLDELKEKFADMYKSAAEEGRTYLDEAQIQAQVLETLFDPEKREAALKKSQLIGTDIITIARAEAGSREDIAIAIDVANQKAEELQSKSKDASGTTSVWAAGVQGLVSDYESLIGTLDANAEAAKLAQESAARGEEQHRGQIQQTRDADQARWEAQAAARAAAAEAAATPIVQEVIVKVNSKAWDDWTPNPKTGVLMAQYNDLNSRSWE